MERSYYRSSCISARAVKLPNFSKFCKKVIGAQNMLFSVRSYCLFNRSGMMHPNNLLNTSLQSYVSCSTITKLAFILNSQSAERTNVHVYLPYRGAILFYVYIVPLGLISIFLYVGRVQISCGLLPTRFCLKFSIKLLLSKKGEISD